LLGVDFGSTFSISSISTSQVEVNTTSESKQEFPVAISVYAMSKQFKTLDQ
jgi:hypothetical protein